MNFAHLLLCYGICFALMNKIEFLHGKIAIVDRLLKCSFCTGFHSGYISFILVSVSQNHEWSIASVPAALCWAFTSAASCFILDVCTQLLEKHLADAK